MLCSTDRICLKRDDSLSQWDTLSRLSIPICLPIIDRESKRYHHSYHFCQLKRLQGANFVIETGGLSAVPCPGYLLCNYNLTLVPNLSY